MLASFAQAGDYKAWASKTKPLQDVNDARVS